MQPSLLVLPLLVMVEVHANLAPRHLDEFSTGFMMEDGNMRGAAPECGGLGWVYHNGHCYLFDRFSVPQNYSCQKIRLTLQDKFSF